MSGDCDVCGQYGHVEGTCPTNQKGEQMTDLNKWLDDVYRDEPEMNDKLMGIIRIQAEALETAHKASLKACALMGGKLVIGQSYEEAQTKIQKLIGGSADG